jgi:hypothetical protein
MAKIHRIGQPSSRHSGINILKMHTFGICHMKEWHNFRPHILILLSCKALVAKLIIKLIQSH